MHTCCLCVVTYAVGNIMFELFYQLGGWLGNSMKSTASCGQLLTMMKSMSKELGVDPPFGDLTGTMIRKKMGGGPKMALKAAEGRHFVPVLRLMLLHCFGLDSAHAQLRFDCLGQLSNCYVLIKEWKDDGECCIALAKAARAHLILYKQLKQQRSDSRTWDLKPKHHLFVHCAEDRSTNPASEWCYMDEDEIGKAVTIAQAVHPGRIRDRLLPRYCTTLAFI